MFLSLRLTLSVSRKIWQTNYKVNIFPICILQDFGHLHRMFAYLQTCHFLIDYILSEYWLIWHVATNLNLKSLHGTTFTSGNSNWIFFLIQIRNLRNTYLQRPYICFSRKNIQSYLFARNMQVKCIFAFLMVGLHSSPCLIVSYSTLLIDIEEWLESIF